MRYNNLSFLSWIVVLFMAISAAVSCLAAEGSASDVNYVFHVLYLNDVEEQRGDRKIMPGINLKFETADGVFQVAARRNALSKAFRYDTSNVLHFFDEVPVGISESGRQLLASVDLGASGTKIVVVTKTTSGGYAARALDISARHLAPNRFRVLNFSDQLVYAKVNDTTNKIKPREAADFKVKGDKKRFLVQVGLATLPGEKPYVFGKKRMTMRQNGRKLLIVHNRAGRPGKLTYKEMHLPDEVAVADNVSDKELEEFDNSIYFNVGE